MKEQNEGFKRPLRLNSLFIKVQKHYHLSHSLKIKNRVIVISAAVFLRGTSGSLQRSLPVCPPQTDSVLFQSAS